MYSDSSANYAAPSDRYAYSPNGLGADSQLASGVDSYEPARTGRTYSY